MVVDARAGRTNSLRSAGSVLAIAVMTFLLSGCFVIPLLDDRSPFDDPFGASTREVDAAAPQVQSALDGVDPRGGAWSFEAEPWADRTCEGRCHLHVRVTIRPVQFDLDDLTDADRAVTVPADVLRDVLTAVVPVGEETSVDIRVRGDEGIEVPADVSAYLTFPPIADLGPAVTELFGPVPEYGLDAEKYRIDEDLGEYTVIAHTRDTSGVLEAMGL